jgi:hypothetical protein
VSVAVTPVRVVKAATAYFALVFGAGFVLGTIRVLWLVPRIGIRAAELLEMPLMLVAIVMASRFVHRRFLGAGSEREAVTSGLGALGQLLAAECVLAWITRRATPVEVLTSKDPVSGTVYYAMLGLFAALPWLRAHARNARRTRPAA